MLASAALLVATIFYDKESRVSKKDNDQILAELDLTLLDFEKQSQLDYERFKTYLDANQEISFVSLNEEFKIPVTIFEGEKPKFWSASSVVFDPNIATKASNFKVVSIKSSKIAIIRNEFQYNNKKYVLIHQLWLKKKYATNNAFLKSGLNRAIFPEKVGNIYFKKGENNVYYNENFVFSISFEENIEQSNAKETIILLTLVLLSFAGLLAGIFFLLHYLVVLKKGIWAWGVLLFCNTVAIICLYCFRSNIFQPFVFQWIDFDLLFGLAIAVAFFTILFMPFRYDLRLHGRISKLNFGEKYFFIIDFFLTILNAFALYALFEISKYWYQHPYYSFNIFNIGIYTSEKLITLIILLLAGLGYFMFSHIVAQYLHRRSVKKGKKAILSLVLLTGFSATIAAWYLNFYAEIISFSTLYLSISVWQNWPSTLHRPRYITYLYLFFCIIIVSLAISTAGYYGEKQLHRDKSKKWAEKIDKEAGVIDIYKLKMLADSLKSDTLIKEALAGQSQDLENVEQTVVKNYISKSFEEYESNVYLFNNKGVCLNKSVKNYFFYYSNYSKPKFRTQFKGIFKVVGTSTNYYSFVPFYSNSVPKGYLILEFKLRRLIPNSIMPALFKEKVSTLEYNDSKPNFAIFKNEVLVSESGNLNMQKLMPRVFNKKNQSIREGEFDLYNYYQHFDFDAGKSVLIAYQVSIIKILGSNFSFLFAIFSGVLAVFIFSNTFYFKMKQVSTTFTTKIQLFINIAFFLPLVAVSITSFTIMNTVFKADLEKSYNEKVNFVSQNISSTFSRFTQNKISIDEMTDELEGASKYVQSDVVLYDANGKMILNTQPSLFEWSVLSPYVSPFAFANISERKEAATIIDESLGKFQFKTVYSPMKSYDSGIILGFVAIPFFESDFVFKEKVMDSITAILNIFTLIFILFLAITYLFSRQLTLPLVMLTQKMKYTSLEKNNEPLIYAASDEIGILVKEYNRMLKKLEENKKVLANTEKEIAWREMAKQVAHEIKNPLTPMKLALQNMQRMLSTDRDDKHEIALRSAAVLLEQIENLNEIAGSFATFAQMPLPKKLPFELVKLIQNVVFLFQSENEVNINFSTNLQQCTANGDENMMNRIMINLVRNAIESVPADRITEIEITLEVFNENAEIKVKDNGTGIDETLGSKIFQPNFSTKTSGSGIGLALAKRGLEQMGGKIRFSSQVGSGSEFVIKMPLV
ncbi:MAG: sensor histidine kinase [Cytophagales bacterium]